MSMNSGIVNIIKQEGGCIKSIGTGFLVASNQLLTCFHVVRNAQKGFSQIIKFKFEDSDNIYTANICTESFDESIDIALLEIEDSFSFYYKLESNWSKNQACQTKGFPKDSTKISPSNPILEEPVDNGNKFKLSNANDICSGFSGAPLINNNGHVIGVIASTPEPLRVQGNMLNIAHAIPVSVIIRKIPFLRDMYNYVSDVSPEERRNQIVQYLNNLKEGCLRKLKEIHSGLYPLSGNVFTQKPQKYYGAEDMDLRIDYQPFDESGEKKEREDDIFKCINGTAKKVVLLGEPGCGKSVSLLKLTAEYADRALKDEEELIPILIPLGSYKDEIRPVEYIKKRMSKDTSSIDSIFDPNKCIFIFDALNEVASNKRDSVVSYILSLNHYIVSCRLLDYKKEFSKQKDIIRIEILELNLSQIRDAITHRIYRRSEENLWTELEGNDALISLWNNMCAEGKEELFWKAPNIIKAVELQEIKEESTAYEYEAWQRMHSRGLMSLCRNPMMLRMIYDLYLKNETNLPKNRGQLFEQFTNECLDSEMRKIDNKKEKTSSEQTILKENTLKMLTGLSEMIISNKQGTGIRYCDGYDFLKKSFTELEIAEMEKFAHDASILIVDEEEYRFIHQLHQEYFASRFMYLLFKRGDKADVFFNSTSWWKPEGWEESAILLAGILNGDERNRFFIWLSDSQPKLVIRCIEKSGIIGLSTSTLDTYTKETIQEKLISRINNNTESQKSRIYIGQSLDKIGDSRIGVGTIKTDFDEYPEFEWIPINNTSLYVSKYHVTVKQYASFVNAKDGYLNDFNWDFSIESREWHKARKTKPTLPELGNAPIVYVSWYDAVAFCKWLSGKNDAIIRLPREKEWIQLVESHNLKISDITENDLLDMDDSAKMVSVGLNSSLDYSNNSISDIGLIWEWCEDLYGRKPEELGIINPKSLPTCILKGGSWRYTEKYKTSQYCCRTYAYQTAIDIGFRVVKEIKV